MNRASITQASCNVRQGLMAIVDHLTRARGFSWPISLAVINQQSQMVWLTMKTGRVGVSPHDACVADAIELPRCPPMPPARQWRWNLQRSMVSPCCLDTRLRTSRQVTRPDADCARASREENMSTSALNGRWSLGRGRPQTGQPARSSSWAFLRDAQKWRHGGPSGGAKEKSSRRLRLDSRSFPCVKRDPLRVPIPFVPV